MTKPWQRTEPTKVYKAGWRTMVDKTFIMPDGTTHEFTTINGEDVHCGAVIAITPDRQVVIARQFRPGPELVFDEIPGGFIDQGENVEDGVRRELLEETGYQAAEMIPLGGFRRNAYDNATYHYFLAEGCTPSPTGGKQALQGEVVDVVLISIEQLIANAKQGRMSDGDAVLAAYERLKELALIK